MTAPAISRRTRTSRTEHPRHISRRALAKERVHLQLVEDDERPRTRSECVDGPRPCPWVGCKYNLFLDVNESTGSIRYAYDGREPEDVDPAFSCALDVAARGGATLADIANGTNLTRERIRQIEAKALSRAHARSGVFREFSDAPIQPWRAGGGTGLFASSSEPSADVALEAEPEPAVDREESAERLSFFAEGDLANREVCRDVWRIYMRESVEKGFEVDRVSRALPRGRGGSGR